MPRQTRRVKDPCACKKKKGTGSRCGCGTSSRRRGPRRATAARSVPAAAAGPEPFAKGWNTYYPTHAPFGIDHAYGQRPMLPVVVPHNTGKPLGHAAGGNTLGGSSERAREARGTQTEPVPDPEVIEMGNGEAEEAEAVKICGIPLNDELLEIRTLAADLRAKLSHGVRAVGNKVGDFLLGASPVLAAIPGIGPEAAALSASIGGAAKGVGALAGVAEGALSGKGVDVGSAREGYAAAKGGAGAVRDAYMRARGRGSAIERGG
eukprot:jgi/Tetstr1/421957/TSEL_012856.t1